MSKATEFRPTAVTNTLAGSHQDVARRMGIPATYPERSTLNEHLDILAGRRPEDPKSYTHMRYLVLGNKGHRPMEVVPGVSIEMPIAHKPTDAAPWGIIPMVVRELDDDLTDEQRAKYALRMVKEYHGTRYICYFAKRIDLSGVKVMDYLIKVQNGVANADEYAYTEADLRPPQPELPDYNFDVVDQVLNSDGEYAKASATTLVTLDEFDLAELINMSRIVYRTPLAAVVSEWCFVSGQDLLTKGDSWMGTSEIFYDEVICAQVNMFVSQYANAADHSKEMSLTVNVGQSTPYPLYTGIPNAASLNR